MDPILFWNDVMLELNARDHTGEPVAKAVPTRGPTGTSRAFAIVHLAMHDAVFAVAGRATHTGTIYAGPANDFARDAAVSAAAVASLTALWPEHTGFITTRALTVKSGGAGAVQGHAVGLEVAYKVLSSRENDGAKSTFPGAFSTAYGHHRADPGDPAQGLLGSDWGRVARFFAPAHVPLDPPPGHDTPDYLIDPDYLADHQEVRELGGIASPTRTPDQTVIGIYWAYDGVEKIGTPPRLYNQIMRTIADNNKNTVEDNAKLFAMANVAMANAAIDAWHWKFHYDLWRPVVGIREALKANGPSGGGGANSHPDCDPFWLPLGAPDSNKPKKGRDFTPPFPAYPSGHATFGAAVFQSIQLFYGEPPLTVEEILSDAPTPRDKVAFDAVSDEMNGITRDARGVTRPRHVRRFTELATPTRENALSRVYLGVHWRFDGLPRDPEQNVGGVPLGLRIAEEVAAKWPGMKAP